MSAVEQPFGTIENTQEFLTILSEKIDEVLAEASREHTQCAGQKEARRAQAWQVVLYTTSKLSSHIATSRKLMSDLARLRSVLTSEIQTGAAAHE